jgi:hypothetical protein
VGEDFLKTMNPLYVVRVSFVNRYGSPFHWDFYIETDDYGQAVDEALLTFWSGLTFDERYDAAQTFNIMARLEYLPEPVAMARAREPLRLR